eukprot:jgi/Ulvmu1/1690/UM115_0019.1
MRGALHASAAWYRPPLAAGASPPPPPDQIVAAANPPEFVPATIDTEQLCADNAALHLRSVPPPPPPPETDLDSVGLPASVADRTLRNGSPGDRPLSRIGPGCIFSPDYAALCEQFPLAIDFDSQGPNSDMTQGHGSAPLVATMAKDILCGRPSIPAACTGSDILPPSPRVDAPFAAASADSAPAAASPASSGDLASDAHRAFKERVMASLDTLHLRVHARPTVGCITTDVPLSPTPSPAASLLQSELPEDMFPLQDEISREYRRAQ